MHILIEESCANYESILKTIISVKNDVLVLFCMVFPLVLGEFLQKELPDDISLKSGVLPIFKRSRFQVLLQRSLFPLAHFRFRIFHPIML